MSGSTEEIKGEIDRVLYEIADTVNALEATKVQFDQAKGSVLLLGLSSSANIPVRSVMQMGEVATSDMEHAMTLLFDMRQRLTIYRNSL